MAIGYLTMQARTAHEALPLGGVLVSVLDDEQNRIYELTTDKNGETRRVSLETMDKRYSQDENFTGTPYVTYNVLAQAEGFDSVYVSDIPIFDGESAVLPLVLVPMQGQRPDRMQTWWVRPPFPWKGSGSRRAPLTGESRGRCCGRSPFRIRSRCIWERRMRRLPMYRYLFPIM